MENSWRGLIYILGIITAAYLLIKYVLPLVLKGLEILLSAALWIGIAVLVVYLVMYAVKMLNER
ncbi:MAG: hypothetical protein KBA61_10805 [Spirochaetes bacterium]|nr:hypothetical protein [Spirochaetota bacterium]HPA71472.1 hypothetical protein [Spirochaetota bacterium]